MPNTVRTTQQQLDAANENILVIIGRLLEATKAASDGIKTLSEESKANTTALQALQAAVTANQNTIHALDTLVRTGNGDSLVTQLRLVSESVQQHLTDYADDMKVLDKVKDAVESLERDKVGRGSTADAVWKAVYGVGWLVTTAVAVYAAIKGH